MKRGGPGHWFSAMTIELLAGGGILLVIGGFPREPQPAPQPLPQGPAMATRRLMAPNFHVPESLRFRPGDHSRR